MTKRICLFLLLAILAIVSTGAAAQDGTSEHCAVELAPIVGKFDVKKPQLSPVVRENCFQSFAESVSFATRGRINLPATASDAEVLEAVQKDMQISRAAASRGGVTPLVTYTLAYMYDWSNYQTNGGTLVVSSSTLCSSNNFYAYNLTSFQNQGNWANRIESWQRASGSGCNTAGFYDLINMAGTGTLCGSPCAALGTLSNKAESFIISQ